MTTMMMMTMAKKPETQEIETPEMSPPPMARLRLRLTETGPLQLQ
jgi:hypothetical protein